MNNLDLVKCKNDVVERKYRLSKLVYASSIFAMTLLSTSFSHATDFATSVPGSKTTSAQLDNKIHILSTGQIVDGPLAPGVVVLDSLRGKVIVDPNNINPNAVLNTNTPEAALLITGDYGELNIGAKSKVISSGKDPLTDYALWIDAPHAKVTNSGIIFADSVTTVFIDEASNDTLINQLHGVIGAGDENNYPTVLLDELALTFSLDNAGTISSNSNSAVQLRGQFSNIINRSSGHILSNTGIALDIEGPNFSPDKGGNLILNEAGAWIESLNNTAIYIQRPLKTFLNNGYVSSNIISAVDIKTPVQVFTNNGYLTSHQGTAVNVFVSNFDFPINDSRIFTNKGDIVGNSSGSFGGTIIYESNLSEGFFNYGNIINLDPDGNAVHMCGGQSILAPQLALNDVQISFYQNDGLIVGNIDLPCLDSQGGPNVLTLNGGRIAGDIKAAGFENYIHRLQGGMIEGVFFLGPLGDTVYLQGTKADQIVGVGDSADDTFYLKSGSFNAIDGKAGNNVIYVPNSFDSTGYINNVQTIEIQNRGTVFTIDAYINNLDNALIVYPGTTVIQHFPISGGGQIKNSGLYKVEGNAILNLDSFLNLPRGILSLGPTDTLQLNAPPNINPLYNAPNAIISLNIKGVFEAPTQYSKILVDSSLPAGSGILLDKGSFIAPTFAGFIPDNSQYNVITLSSLGARITDNSSIAQPFSVIVSFSKALNVFPQNNLLTLTAHRNSYQSLSSTPYSYGVAGALDFLAIGSGPTNADLYYLLSQLDQSATQIQLEQAMESLTPPFNYALIEGAHLGLTTAFENITDRIWNFAWPSRLGENNIPILPNGINSGDNCGMGMWAAPMGAYVRQNSDKHSQGYRAEGIGAIVGIDYSWNPCVLLGIAGSYFKSVLDDRNVNPKNESVNSWQASAYLSTLFDYGFYLDSIFAASTNRFQINRTIHVHDLNGTAQSRFGGPQVGLQFDLGWIAPVPSIFLATPFVRLNYIQLFFKNYTESGAEGFNLHVHNHKPVTMAGAVGMRFAMNYLCGQTQFIPEVDILAGYDFKNDAEQTNAYFIAGSPTFITPGFKPNPSYIDLGIGLNMIGTEQSIFTLKYNLELRQQYFANTGYIQYYWQWS